MKTVIENNAAPVYPISKGLMNNISTYLFSESEGITEHLERRNSNWVEFERWLRTHYRFASTQVEAEDCVVDYYAGYNGNFYIWKDCGVAAVHAIPAVLKNLLWHFDRRRNK